MTDEERKPLVKWRSLPVCSRCWMNREFDRPPARLLDAPTVDCTLCEDPTDEGIFVRMRVEWR